MPSEIEEAPRPSRRRLPRRRLPWVAAFLPLVLALVTTSCATVPERDPASGCANCPVCLHNADLACVCVKVGDDTPRVEWNGKTWYFCSEECRKAFLSDPKRFSPADGATR
jgi:hypothetical protein